MQCRQGRKTHTAFLLFTYELLVYQLHAACCYSETKTLKCISTAFLMQLATQKMKFLSHIFTSAHNSFEVDIAIQINVWYNLYHNQQVYDPSQQSCHNGS